MAMKTGSRKKSGGVHSEDRRDAIGRTLAEDTEEIDTIILARAEKLANLGYWEWDLITNAVKWSDGHFRIFGYPIKHGTETYGMFRDRVHPDDIEGVERMLREGMEKDTCYNWDYRLVWPDGSIRYVHAEADRPVKDQAGKPVRWFGIAQDVTERMRAEEKLAEKEKFLRNTFECIQDGISVLDKDLNIIQVNPVMEKRYGRLITGKKCFQAYHGRSEPCEACPSIRAIKAGTTQTGIVYDLNGWSEIYAFPMVNDRGEVAGVIEHVRDINERKQIEHALRASEEKYRYLVENANSIIIRWDMQGNLTFFNEFAEKLFGYSKNEVLGRNVVGTIVPLSESTGRDLVALMGEVERHPERYELNVNENVCKNGDRVWIAWTNKAIRDGQGNLVEILSVGNDITERKLAEEALMDAKAQAELYVDLMGHDINNMNQISMGFLELAHNIIEMNGKLGEDNIVLLDKATDALKDSSQLIGNVRKLQREKMGLYKPEVIDVGAMAQDAVKQFHSIPGRNIKITCNTADHCFVRANGLLKDVFVNLVGNAVKHSRGDLMVNVLVDRVVDDGKAYCRASVEDDGPGIPDHLKVTLFDRLNLTATRAKGKGFGLCLIKMLVDDYKGKFRVEDRVTGDFTNGARFIVMLPAIEER